MNQDRDDRKVWRKISSEQSYTNDRIARLEKATPMKLVFLDNTTTPISAVAMTGTYLSPDMRGTAGIPTNAKGFMGSLRFVPVNSNVDLYIGSSDTTPTINSQVISWLGAADTNRQLVSSMVMIPLGADGKFQVVVSAGALTVSISVFAYLL